MEKEEKTIEKSNDEMAERMEKATTRLEELNKKWELQQKEEEIRKVEAKLSGQSEAGIKAEKKEETPKEYAKRVMEGRL